jgi:Domain of unknown function (DUF397)
MRLNTWFKPEASGGSETSCVQYRELSDGTILVRDTKESDVLGDAAPTLVFTAGQWLAFLILVDVEDIFQAMTAGSTWIRVLGDTDCVTITVVHTGDNYDWSLSGQAPVVLSFTPREIAAFILEMDKTENLQTTTESLQAA